MLNISDFQIDIASSLFPPVFYFHINSTLCSLPVMVHLLGSFEAISVLSTFDVYFAARNKTQASRFSNTFQSLTIVFS